MSIKPRAAACLLIIVIVAPSSSVHGQSQFAVGQFGPGTVVGGAIGGGFFGGATTSGSFQESPRLQIAEPGSKTAQEARDHLDRLVELGEIKTPLGTLADLLMKRLGGVPVFVDSRGIQMAGLSADSMITAQIARAPLRSALRRLLQPHALRVIVEEQGFVITADFSELTRRGIATAVWVDRNVEVHQRIRESLDQRISVDLRNQKLDEAVARLGDAAGIPIVVDRRALDEGGIEIQQKLGLRIKNAKLRSVLKLAFRNDAITYLVANETLQITTRDAAEETLSHRIYFLEGTGFIIGDSSSVAQLIQTTITPFAWEEMGGLSNICVVSHGQRARPAILVSTNMSIHKEIEAFFRVMREMHVGADPVIGPMRGPTIPLRPPQPAPVVGGLF